MILSAILFGATAITVMNIIDAFWNDILDFLKKAANKVKQVIKGVLYGSKVFIKKTYEAIQEISRHYSWVDEHWEETTVTRKVSPNEVPKDILNRYAMMDQEVDVTDELEMKLTA